MDKIKNEIILLEKELKTSIYNIELLIKIVTNKIIIITIKLI
jgi:hypothetical protein